MQGQNSIFKPRITMQGTKPHQENPTGMPLPPWTLNQLQQKFECKNSSNHEPRPMDNPPNNGNNNRNNSIVASYIHGIGEMFKETCNNKGIQVHFKGTNTIKTLFMVPKDKDSKLHKSGVIYQFKCPHIKCPEEYIGESGRAFWYRIKEHLRAPSPIHQHSKSTGHLVSPGCFTIIHRESQMCYAILGMIGLTSNHGTNHN